MENKKPVKTEERDDGIFDYFYYDDTNPYRGGYWIKREEDWKQSLRVPLACPACKNLLMNWDTQFYHRWGVCANCYIDHLENRENLPKFSSNVARAEYVKQKIAEKIEKP